MPKIRLPTLIQFEGWLLVILGWLFTVAGAYFVFININYLIEYASIMWDGDIYFSTIIEWCLIIWLFDIGVTSLILGIRRITHKGKINQRRIRGWILLIIGSPIISFSCIIPSAQIYQIIANPSSKITIVEIGSYIYWPILEIVISIPLVILGFWQLFRKEKIPLSDLDGLDYR